MLKAGKKGGGGGNKTDMFVDFNFYKLIVLDYVRNVCVLQLNDYNYQFFLNGLTNDDQIIFVFETIDFNQ